MFRVRAIKLICIPLIPELYQLHLLVPVSDLGMSQ